ncbi:MAG: pyridoxal-dependent decarboxylase [Acidobacteriota bacterium]
MEPSPQLKKKPPKSPSLSEGRLGGARVSSSGSARPKPDELLKNATNLLFEHSLFNGHRSFYGYITSSAAPIGMLAELLAAAVNANVGAWKLAPMATEIESQTIRWLAQFIDYPADCGGLLLSGGNMANLTCFLAARVAKADWDVRKHGVAGGPPLLVYASTETHTWIQKAADLTGLGTDPAALAARRRHRKRRAAGPGTRNSSGHLRSHSPLPISW